MEGSDGAYWMNWEICRQAAEGGTLELGVHTHATHKYPGIQRREGESREEYRERLAADLDTAIDLIRENAGITPIYFAYPHGITDEWATDLIDERFMVTVTTFAGVNDPDDGTYNLMRYNMGETSNLDVILP
jgi:peptidoglycan/xylan/chitin deacetylase (PgdA/CDA1 family)